MEEEKQSRLSRLSTSKTLDPPSSQSAIGTPLRAAQSATTQQLIPTSRMSSRAKSGPPVVTSGKVVAIIQAHNHKELAEQWQTTLETQGLGVVK